MLIKGADYSLDGVVGRDLVEGYGGEVKLADLVEVASPPPPRSRSSPSAHEQAGWFSSPAARGFIGSNIVARFCQDPGIEVAVCDWLGDAGEGKWRNLAKHPIADFIAPEQMFAWLKLHADEVELVVHMGAVSSTTEPDADLVMRSNFVLSRDVFDWCAETKTRLIYASSGATYGDGEPWASTMTTTSRPFDGAAARSTPTAGPRPCSTSTPCARRRGAWLRRSGRG